MMLMTVSAALALCRHCVIGRAAQCVSGYALNALSAQAPIALRLGPRSRSTLRSMSPLGSSLRAALTPPATGATAPHRSPSAGWPALAAGRRGFVRRLPWVAVTHRTSTAAHEPRRPAQRVESRPSVVARYTNVLTNVPSARSLRHSILPCGAMLANCCAASAT